MAKAKQLKTTKPDLQPSEVTEVVKVSFEEYITKNRVNGGLVASFQYEALKTEKGLQDRSEDEWAIDFEAQSNRRY